VEGYWLSVDPKTKKASAGWQTYIVDGTLYAKMLSAPSYGKDDIAKKCKPSYQGFPLSGDVSKMRVFNEITWVYGMTKKSDTVWGGGTIIDPENASGASYNCTITYHPADGKKYSVDTLEVYGSLGPFGRTSIWQRSTPEKASALW
jgi:hypothetical protein